MKFVPWVAWRFMLKGTSLGKFSAMTFFAWMAIAVGTGAMSSLLSVMYGFEGALKERVLNAYPHLMIRPKEGNYPLKKHAVWTEKLSQLPHAARVMPYAETEMILQSDYRTLAGIVWGIPENEMARLQKGLSQGKLPTMDSRLPQVVVGVELAERLGVSPGSRLKLISPIEKGGVMGLVPQTQTFEVSGIYTSGHYEFDQQYLFLLLADVQDLLKWGDAITGWHVWAPELRETSQLLQEVQSVLPQGLQAQSWEVFNSVLFQSLKLEQYAMFTILSFAIAIAVMNIVITLMMHVTHKRTNIGVLRALGASHLQIKKIFVWQGAFLGAVGLTLGAFLTGLFILYVKYFSSYQLPDIYYDRSIPIEIRPFSLMMIYLVATIMIFVGTLYPAQKAARLDPIEAIRE